jgi:hypothetical protein
MVGEFAFGHDEVGGWRQVRGPSYINLSAIVSTMGLLDVDQRLGFIGHQPGEYPDWRVFAKPPGQREICGLLFEDREYLRYEYDPYTAVSEVLGFDFARRAIQVGIPRYGIAKSPVPVNDPDYLPFAYGLYRAADRIARKRTYWSVLPSTAMANWCPLTGFVSQSDGAVSVTELDDLFPPIPKAPAVAETPVQADEAHDPLRLLTSAVIRMEDTLRIAIADLTSRIDEMIARLEHLERRATTSPPNFDTQSPNPDRPSKADVND